MSSCCGGNADIVLAAKAALDRANGPAGAWLPGAAPAAANEGPPVARMRFTGPNRGAITYRGRVSGQSYLGGNNPLDQYADVDPRDVEYLVSLGVWEVVQQPAPQLTAAPAPAQPPPDEPIASRPLLDLTPDMPATAERAVNAQAAELTKRTRRGRG